MYTGMSIRRDENGRFTDKTPEEHEAQRKRRNARRRQLYHKALPNAPYRDMNRSKKPVKKSSSRKK